MDNSSHVPFLTPEKEGNRPLLEDDISDSESTLNSKASHRSKASPRWVIYVTIFGTFLATLIISNLLIWHFSHPVPEGRKNEPIVLTCGKTPEEARSLGCELDVMVYAWTPPACLNKTHALSYFHSQKWPFWRHENRTEEIPADEILAGKYEGYFSIWPFHSAHCQYLLVCIIASLMKKKTKVV